MLKLNIRYEYDIGKWGSLKFVSKFINPNLVQLLMENTYPSHMNYLFMLFYHHIGVPYLSFMSNDRKDIRHTSSER